MANKVSYLLNSALALTSLIYLSSPFALENAFAQSASVNVQSVMTAMENHVNDPRLGEPYAAGDEDNHSGAWLQLFGGDHSQSARFGASGYDAWHAGAALGADKQVLESLLMGLGFSYAHTEVESKAALLNKSHINTTQLFLYGSWVPKKDFYLDALLSLAYHHVDSIRNIVVPASIAQARAEGSFHSWQPTFWAEVGYNSTFEYWTVTPHVNFKASRLNPSILRETGAGTLNQTVQYDDTSEMVLGGGLKVAVEVNRKKDLSVKPKAIAQIYHDFSHDNQQSVASFLAGGTSFLTPGLTPPRTSYVGGLGLDIAQLGKWFLSFNYQYTTKTDYHAHEGWLKYKYHWA